MSAEMDIFQVSYQLRLITVTKEINNERSTIVPIGIPTIGRNTLLPK
jgi:hypothetical protein